MTVAIFRGKRRRAAAAVGAVAFGLVALSACDKPTPLATVTVGSTTKTAEATCYNDGDALPGKKVESCLKDGEGTNVIKVSPDEKIRFGVDPKIADNGWTFLLNGQIVDQEPYKKTYRSFPAGALFRNQMGADSPKAQISFVETGSGKALGVWNFTLERD
ncbi:lipoprotein [Streptomyces mashuensis]|uniref:Lipoprotein n=1 Tax=Streptomyces mashuensis TaxID=33904 RepID=A0A919B2L4_9ACTN|nr:DUF2771 domain-containing protein [Streptomyces mashuensis]GHF46809.1 lipoprotein [Streptomyces mashuensis]